MSELMRLFEDGRYSDFLSAYGEEGSDSDSRNSKEVRVALGVSLLRERRPAESLRCLSSVLREYPEDRETSVYITAAGNSLIHVCLERGNSALSVSDYETALREYSQMDHLISNQEVDFKDLNADLVYQLFNNRAVCLLNTGRPEEALSTYADTALTACKSSLSASKRSEWAQNKAIILKSIGRLEEALTQFEECLSETPDRVNGHVGKSESLSGLERYSEAEQAATEGLQVCEDEKGEKRGLYVARAYARMKSGNYDGAMSDLDLVDTKDDNSDTVSGEAKRLRSVCMSLHGDNLLSKGDAQGAIDVYSDAIAKAGTDSPVSLLFNCALAHMQAASANRGGENAAYHAEKAASGFEAVISREKGHFQGHVGLGQALLQSADLVTGDESKTHSLLLKAANALETAHSINSSDIEVTYSLAVTLLRTDQPEQASNRFRDVLKVSPNHENALKGLSACEERVQSKATMERVKTLSLKHSDESKKADAKPATTEEPQTPQKAPNTGGSPVFDLLNDIRNSENYFSLADLKTPGPYPSGVNPAHRELYLHDDEFAKVLGCPSKEEFLKFPQWKQVSKKKSAGLF